MRARAIEIDTIGFNERTEVSDFILEFVFRARSEVVRLGVRTRIEVSDFILGGFRERVSDFILGVCNYPVPFNVLCAVDLSRGWLNVKRAEFVQITEDFGKFFRGGLSVEPDERFSIFVTTDKDIFTQCIFQD
jgi:hypothetical protein